MVGEMFHMVKAIVSSYLLLFSLSVLNAWSLRYLTVGNCMADYNRDLSVILGGTLLNIRLLFLYICKHLQVWETTGLFVRCFSAIVCIAVFAGRIEISAREALSQKGIMVGERFRVDDCNHVNALMRQDSFGIRYLTPSH